MPLGERNLYFNPGGAFIGFAAKSAARSFNPVLWASGYGPAGGPFINDAACLTMSADAVNLKATLTLVAGGGPIVATPSDRVKAAGYVFSYDAYSGLSGLDPEPIWNFQITLEPLDPNGAPPHGTVDYGGCYFIVTGYADTGLILDTFQGPNGQQIAYHVPEAAPLAPGGETAGWMGTGAFGNVLEGNKLETGGNSGTPQSQRLYAGRHTKVRVILEGVPRNVASGYARCGLTVRASQVPGNSDVGLDSIDLVLAPNGANQDVYWSRRAAGAGVEGPLLLGSIPWALNQARQLLLDFKVDDSGIEVYGADVGGANPVLVGTMAPAAMWNDDAHRYVGILSTHHTDCWDVTRFQVLQPHLVAPAAVALTMAEKGALPDPVAVAVGTLPEGYPDTGVAISGIAYGDGSGGWLAAALAGTETPGTLALTVLAAADALLPGAHTATVSLVSDLAVDEPVEVVVTLTVTDMAPVSCELRLAVYEDDAATIAWEVSTNPLHDAPYLVEPGRFDQQEIDVAAGSAKLSTVTVCVVDRATIAGDQDSGWLTAKLGAGGASVLAGRRCRLRRYVPGIGWRLVADGPAGMPKLDPSYAAFSWEVRDTREIERKLSAFDLASDGTTTIFPEGVVGGFGYSPNARYQVVGGVGYWSNWLVPPVVPATGYVVARDGLRAGTVAIGNGSFPYNVRDPSWSAMQGTFVLGAPVAVHTAQLLGLDWWWDIKHEYEVQFTNGIRAQWRLHSGGAWHVLDSTLVIRGYCVVRYIMDIRGGHWPYPSIPSLPGFTGAEDAALGQIPSISGIPADQPSIALNGLNANGPPNAAPNGILLPLHWLVFGDGAASPDVPVLGQEVDVLVIGSGASEAQPVHVDGITAGQFLQNLYDGVYSERGPAGELVPSGIRYDAAALALMTDPVCLRLTKPITDVRTFTEKSVYAVTGWIPALDADGQISPRSATPPASLEGLPVLSDTNCEPAPDWAAGNAVINLLRLTYPRIYLPVDPLASRSSDGLATLNVVVEYDDAASMARFGEHSLELDGSCFTGLCFTQDGLPDEITAEPGWLEAAGREAVLGPRYAGGAPAIHLAAMQEEFPTLRAGDWVVLNLSWLPDYLTQRRGLVALAQVLSIGDLDCAWRDVVVEIAAPVAGS